MLSYFMAVTNAVDSRLATFFYDLGHLNGRRPWTMLLAAVAVAFALAAGLTSLVSEDEGSKLWVPQDTVGQEYGRDYAEFFPAPRFNRITITSNPNGDNVLTVASHLAAAQLHDALTKVTVVVDDVVYTYSDIVNFSPVPSWIQNPDSITPNDGNPFGGNSNETESLSDYTDQKLLDLINSATGDAFRPGLGSPTYETNGVTVKTAKAFDLIYFVKPDDSLEEVALLWEQELIDLALAGSKFGDSSDIEPVWGTEVDTYPFAARTFSDEFGDVIRGDVVLLAATYFLISAYVIVNFWRCDTVQNNLGLSGLVVLNTGLGIMAGFGLSAICGFLYTPLHSVLPFVLLGIGVDNCFVLVNAFSQTNPTHTIALRSAEALRHAGTSITVTSATDVVAFAVGSKTSLPALSSFCAFATFAILFQYLFNITYFQACIVLNAKRKSTNTYDCCCCFTSKKTQPKSDKVVKDGERHTQSKVSKFLEHSYGPFVTSIGGGVFIMTITIGMLVLGVYGWGELEVASAEANFIPDSSYAKATLNIGDEYYKGVTNQAFVVIKDIDYFARQDDVITVFNTFNNSAFEDGLPFIQQPLVDSWYHRFIEWLSTNVEDPSHLDTQGRPNTRELFYQYVEAYIAFYEIGVNRFLPGGPSGDIVFDNSTKTITRSRIPIIHAPIGRSSSDGSFKADTDKQIATMDKMYELVDGLFPDEMYAHSRIYLNEWSTFKIIQDELVSNLAFALGAVFLITLLLIGHPLTSFMVFLCVLLTVVQLLGVSWAWDIQLNTVSVVNFVLAVGLAVDYAAHLGHNFMMKEGTRKERVIAALSDIGAPVLNGAVSTTLAVVLLAASQSYIFRVLFRQFFGACVLGILNGLGTLPVLLSWVGPASNVKVLEPNAKNSMNKGTLGEQNAGVDVVDENEGSLTNP